ncbi:hypothetical protein [Psychrilyobacter atlanticus]|nr:hypothetical protein [Psychrilyobacter atlanticus]
MILTNILSINLLLLLLLLLLPLGCKQLNRLQMILGKLYTFEHPVLK